MPQGGSATGDRVPRINVIFSAEQISQRIRVLAKEVACSKPDDLLVVAILKGSFVFAADLIRALHAAGVSPEVDFMTLASYRKSKKSSGEIEILRDLETDVSRRNVLLVDDILESGRTLAYAKDLIAARGAGRVLTCVLLDKPVPRSAEIEADLTAFRCPDVFVVGYGMDLAHKYRELPFVGCIMED